MRLLALLILLLSFGCAPRAQMTADTSGDPLAHGYTLLDALLRDEARLGGILVVRSPSAETRTLIQEIARRCGAAVRELDELEPPRADGVLPQIELDVRGAVAQRTSRELMFGREFEIRVLLSQIEALRYGRHLALETGKLEEDPERAAWLQTLADDLAALRERAVQRLAVKE